VNRGADAVARFEAERARLVWRQRAGTFIGLGLASAVLWGSVILSGVADQSLGADPWGRVAAFLDRLAPDLRDDALFEGRDRPGSIAFWYYDFPRWVAAAFETLQIAILATVFGAAAAATLSALAARNTMPIGAVRFVVRRIFEILRTTPEIILAIILVAAFGIGPFAGLIAVTLGTIGSLGKLFTEVNENVDPRPAEAVRACGGAWAVQLRYGLAPQIAPNYASYALIRLEVNIATAAALGIVGAGGIGLELERAISFTQFDTYLAILLMILVLIMACDLASSEIRRRLIGLDRAR